MSAGTSEPTGAQRAGEAAAQAVGVFEQIPTAVRHTPLTAIESPSFSSAPSGDSMAMRTPPSPMMAR